MAKDKLAQGAKSATFAVSERCSEEKWSAIWADDGGAVVVVGDKESEKELYADTGKNESA